MNHNFYFHATLGGVSTPALHILVGILNTWALWRAFEWNGLDGHSVEAIPDDTAKRILTALAITSNSLSFTKKKLFQKLRRAILQRFL